MPTVLNTTTGIGARRPLAGRETEVTATAMSTAHVTWIVTQIQKRPPLLAVELTSQDCCFFGWGGARSFPHHRLISPHLSFPFFPFSLSPCLAVHWSHSQVHLRTWGAKVGPIFWRIYTCRIASRGDVLHSCKWLCCVLFSSVFVRRKFFFQHFRWFYPIASTLKYGRWFHISS